MNRPLGCLALVAGLLLGAAPARAQSEPDSLLESAVLELQLGRVVVQTVAALRSDNEALLPLFQFLDLAEIRHQSLPDSSVELLLQPGNVRVTLSHARDTIRVGKQVLPIPAGLHAERDGEIYLGAAILGQALGVEILVNWSDLAATVLDPSPLPVARRVARQASRASLGNLASSTTPDLSLPLERPKWNGLVVDYSILSPSSDFLGGGAYASSLGLDVFGGSLELGLATEGRPRDGHTRTDLSWRGVWRESRWVTQLQLGDGIATGPRPRSVRGFSVSNAPYLRPAILGAVTYGGQLGPGWQLEAYRGGRLIAFDSVNALGQFSIDAPIEYGENPIDFIAYGPFGEVREFNRTYRVAADVLPAKHFEYGAAFGGCRTPLCQATANVDLRYGLNRRWTMQTGVDQFWRDSLSNLSHPYLGLTGAIGNAWGVQLEGVANAVVRGGVRFEPSTDLQLNAEYTDFAERPVDPILTPAGRRNQFTLQGFMRPLPKSGLFYLDGSLDRIESVTGMSTSGRVGASFMVQQIRLMPSVRLQRDVSLDGVPTTRSFVALNSFVLPEPALGSFFGQFTARTALELEGSRSFSAVSAYVSRYVTTGVRMETGLGWARGLGTTFALTLSADLGAVRAYSTMTATRGLPASATQFVQGSLLYNESARRIDFRAGPSMQRSGLAGRVFLDENGNGRFDPSEAPIPGARVLMGMLSATTDTNGLYRVWDVTPYEPVRVTLDSLSLPSPLWIPTYASISVEPGPNRFRSLDLPVLPGGSLEGRVVRDGVAGPQGVAGMQLLLTEVHTGVRRTMVTFSDGGFYALGVKPGEYELSADPRVLERLGLTAEPLPVSVRSAVDGFEVSGLEIRLKQ